jgi:hypothetical protein
LRGPYDARGDPTGGAVVTQVVRIDPLTGEEVVIYP